MVCVVMKDGTMLRFKEAVRFAVPINSDEPYFALHRKPKGDETDDDDFSSETVVAAIAADLVLSVSTIEVETSYGRNP